MRKKLLRFEANLDQNNIIEPGKDAFGEVKGRWGHDIFGNDNPIVLELGCGRGEYAIGLAQKYPKKNFIGIDIKGDRIWYGSKEAEENNLQNIIFLRTQVDLLENFFVPHEVDEIWLTFPGPRPKEKQARKRLTAPKFLNIYKHVLKPGGKVHLKTDSDLLFEFTLENLEARDDIGSLNAISNLYAASGFDEVKCIQTHFEKRFLRLGKTIKYINFSFCDA
ncbi:tRNA (guanosine(46)-N7)-methyltransferase TrmB [Patescibacteria group bacterium]|nr:tRNA (guanosine(46)-N7)-methyltransferase TrmB [Patescibacteria group bacterium]